MTETQQAGTETITVDQFLPHPPESVWRALTEPERLARWWTTGDVRPVVGHRFTLDMDAWGHVPCEVLEVDPARRFVFRFTENWTVSWTLVPEGRGTRLLLEHSGFDLDDPRDRYAFEHMGPGWRDEVLPALATLLATTG